MAQMPEPRHNPNAQLRDYLHADLCDFVQMYESKALAAGDVELASCTRTVHQARLDALLEGREVRGISRFSLPDWHPESTKYGGDPGDRFTLGSDDILRPDKSTQKFVPPTFNRAQRRAAGRGNGQAQ
jgi:hypothetical protein